VKFAPEGSTITLAVEAQPNELVFSVADSGPGIAAQDQPHIFDRYWRAAGQERRGLGLGLAIAKGIVQAHAGRIWVESSPGHGSTFFFTLPIAVGDDV
jgi:signal transduction histidine kinase